MATEKTELSYDTINEKWLSYIRTIISKDIDISLLQLIHDSDDILEPNNYEDLGFDPKLISELNKIFETKIKLLIDQYNILLIWNKYNFIENFPQLHIDFLTFVIENDAEILDFISTTPTYSNTLKSIYKNINDKLDEFKGNVKVKSSNYDLILLVNTHGLIINKPKTKRKFKKQPTLDRASPLHVPIGLPKLYTSPEDMELTFLTATSIGTANIDIFSLLITEIKDKYQLLTEQGDFNVYNLQEHLRTRKKYDVYQLPVSVAKEKYEDVPVLKIPFLHDVGWHIGYDYFERRYIYDNELVDEDSEYVPIHVLHSSHEPLTVETKNIFQTIAHKKGRSAITTRSGNEVYYIYRSELIDEIHSYGYKNVLIVDASCSAFPDNFTHTMRDERGFRRFQRTFSVAGGKRKNKSKKRKL